MMAGNEESRTEKVDFCAAENEVIIHRQKSERATFPPNDKRRVDHDQLGGFRGRLRIIYRALECIVADSPLPAVRTVPLR